MCININYFYKELSESKLFQFEHVYEYLKRYHLSSRNDLDSLTMKYRLCVSGPNSCAMDIHYWEKYWYKLITGSIRYVCLSLETRHGAVEGHDKTIKEKSRPLTQNKRKVTSYSIDRDVQKCLSTVIAVLQFHLTESR